MSQGGSFLDGFEDGAFSGAVGGAIGGAAFSGLRRIHIRQGNQLCIKTRKSNKGNGSGIKSAEPWNGWI